ncbi:MAG TPA: hypothetical protein VFE41_03105 [Acetobacteraceae bacterium]|jgi:hypothetical protein|nr:hypothetical protein [Acetobacteraceae bacterium]
MGADDLQNQHARVEAAIGRYKRVIGDGLHSRGDRRRAPEVAVAESALNRMLELGRPHYVRTARPQTGSGTSHLHP